MSTIKPFVTRHAVTVYFALTFLISWGGVLLVIGGPAGLPGTTEQFNRLFPLAFLAMLAGPSLAGVLLTALVHGRAGFNDVLSRLRTWHAGAGWYAVALFTAPVVMTVVLLALSLTSREFLPGVFVATDTASLLLSGVVVGLLAGFFEELGWTGFAVPELRRRRGAFATGLLVGVPWGAWHLLTNVFWVAGAYAGGLSLGLFLTVQILSFLVGTLPAFRVLMVWVYDRTGSLSIAMLMHASLTASTLILAPVAVTGMSFVTYGVVLAATFWMIVGAIALISRGQPSRQPLQRRAA